MQKSYKKSVRMNRQIKYKKLLKVNLVHLPLLAFKRITVNSKSSNSLKIINIQ